MTAAAIAAGTIIKGDGQVKGLTTGVGLWLSGAIGVAVGAGMYAVSVFIATLSVAILYGLRDRPRQRLPDGHRRAEDAPLTAEYWCKSRSQASTISRAPGRTVRRAAAVPRTDAAPTR